MKILDIVNDKFDICLPKFTGYDVPYIQNCTLSIHQVDYLVHFRAGIYTGLVLVQLIPAQIFRAQPLLQDIPR